MYEFRCDREKAELEYNGFRFDYIDIEKRLCEDYKEDTSLGYVDTDYETYRKEHTELILEDMFCDLGYFDIYDLHRISPSWFSYLADFQCSC